MRNFKHTKDIYSLVHARAMTLLSERKLDSDVIQALEAIYSQQQIMTDSPFVQARPMR